MHEHSLIKNLLEKIQQITTVENKKLLGVNLQLGELAHISASHLKEHFDQGVAGTSLQGVQVTIREVAGIDHPNAQDIILESLEFEDASDE